MEGAELPKPKRRCTMPMYVMGYNGRAGSREKITPGDAATGITPAIMAPVSGIYKGLTARSALVQNQGETAKFTINGTNPTAAAGTDVGMLLTQNNSFEIAGYENIKNFKAIDNVSGQASKIEVVCYF